SGRWPMRFILTFVFPVYPLIEVAQDTRRDTPDVMVPVRNLIIVANDAVPVATLAPVIFRRHQIFQRYLEDVGDLGAVGRQDKIRLYTRHGRQNAKAAKSQIEVEIPEGLAQPPRPRETRPRRPQRR